MQGYILRVQKVRDEDCIVTILTQDRLIRCYRFYGARHAAITQGFKLDFELVQNAVFLPHLRGVMHLGFEWLFSRDRLLAWQNFMRLLGTHLDGVESVDGFYFELLESSAKKLKRQNPLRVVTDAYLQILSFEGRLHSDLRCFACDEMVGARLSLARGFLPAHPECLSKFCFNRDDIEKLFATKNSAHIDIDIIKELYYIVLEGL